MSTARPAYVCASWFKTVRITSSFLPMNQPLHVSTLHHMSAPSPVNVTNFARFIRAIPPRMEMRRRVTGGLRPHKVLISPYAAEHGAERLRLRSELHESLLVHRT